MSKAGSKYSFLAALIILSLLGAIGSNGQTDAGPDVITTSAQTLATSVVAKIIPPEPYQVYVGEAYVLSVGVQYSVLPPDMTIFLYIVSESYTSQFQPVTGSGVTAISLQLQAPPSPSNYMLQLNLYVRIPGQEATVWDSATVPYQVVQPVVTDWDVKKAWVEPESPGVGDQVTFHATIAIRSTTSTEPLSVVVAAYLDKKLYYAGSLTFQAPSYDDQDFEVPKEWTAVKGTHVLTVVVDPEGRHNDPTPYPYSNFKEVQFAVEEYYAIIKSVSAPQEVKQGEEFNVVVTVEYKLPPNTNLKIDHWYWYGTSGYVPAHDQATDTVSGSGSRDYAFKAKAPFTGTCSAPGQQLNGNATVMFDMGKGWQMTGPGAWKSYSVNVKSPAYFAKLLSVKAQPSVNQSILVSVEIDYYLPKETGLRVTVSQTIMPGNSSLVIWKDESNFTQAQEPAEIGVVMAFLYYFACSACSGNSTTLIFHATLDYLACGGWQSGGEASTQISVPNPPSPKLAKTPLDYLMAALQTIVNWFKKLFGL
jgi:hypothetical protein